MSPIKALYKHLKSKEGVTFGLLKEYGTTYHTASLGEILLDKNRYLGDLIYKVSEDLEVQI